MPDDTVIISNLPSHSPSGSDYLAVENDSLTGKASVDDVVGASSSVATLNSQVSTLNSNFSLTASTIAQFKAVFSTPMVARSLTVIGDCMTALTGVSGSGVVTGYKTADGNYIMFTALASTNGYQYSGWMQISNNSVTRIDLNSKLTTSERTVTRINNSYFDATSVGRCKAYVKAGWLYLYLNLQVSTTIPVLSDFVDIFSIANAPLEYGGFQTVVGQYNPGKAVLFSLFSSGTTITVQVFTATGAASGDFYRAAIALPLYSSY